MSEIINVNYQNDKLPNLVDKAYFKVVPTAKGLLFLDLDIITDLSYLSTPETWPEHQHLLKDRLSTMRRQEIENVSSWYHIYRVEFNGAPGLISRGIRHEEVERNFETVDDFGEHFTFINLNEAGFKAPFPIGIYRADGGLERRQLVKDLNAIDFWAEHTRFHRDNNEFAADLLMEKYGELLVDLKSAGFNITAEMRPDQLMLDKNYLLSDDSRDMFWIVDGESILLQDRA